MQRAGTERDGQGGDRIEPSAKRRNLQKLAIKLQLAGRFLAILPAMIHGGAAVGFVYPVAGEVGSAPWTSFLSPNRLIRATSVVGFRPNNSAVPPGP